MMKITGLEANLLLYGLDALLGVNQKGKLTKPWPGYTMAEVQNLRDRLFFYHEHPEEDEDAEESKC